MKTGVPAIDGAIGSAPASPPVNARSTEPKAQAQHVMQSATEHQFQVTKLAKPNP